MGRGFIRVLCSGICLVIVFSRFSLFTDLYKRFTRRANLATSQFEKNAQVEEIGYTFDKFTFFLLTAFHCY